MDEDFDEFVIQNIEYKYESDNRIDTVLKAEGELSKDDFDHDTLMVPQSLKSLKMSYMVLKEKNPFRGL